MHTSFGETSKRALSNLDQHMAPDAAILACLRRHKIQFVVVGGHAVNYHGFIRSTEDVDIVWFRSPESESALSHALSEMGACYIGKEIDPATRMERLIPVTTEYIRASHLMMLWTGSGFLDLFDYIPGYPQADVTELFQTSVETEGVRFASLRWLLQMKKAAGRPKDLIDLENLPSSKD
jgi:hypothetical protein